MHADSHGYDEARMHADSHGYDEARMSKGRADKRSHTVVHHIGYGRTAADGG